MPFMDIFSPRYKLPIHIVEIVFIAVAMGLSVPRLFMKNQPRTRANTIALGMGAKSLIFIAYQILSEHVGPFKKWASLKANMIINFIEPVFWGAVIFLIIQANIARCVGIGCKLSWGVMAAAIIINQLAVYMAVVSFLQFRRFKQEKSLTHTTSSETSQSYDLPKYGQQEYEVSRGRQPTGDRHGRQDV